MKQHFTQSGQPFSLSGLIRGMADPDRHDITAMLPHEALSATRAAEHGFTRPGVRGNAVYLPMSILSRDLNLAQVGPLTAGRPRVMPASVLRGVSLVADLGVRMVEWAPGASPSIPTLTKGVRATTNTDDVPDVAFSGFVAEGADVLAADLSFGLATAVTGTVGASLLVSRRLLLQAGELADAMIADELMGYIGERLDWAFLSGTGAGGAPAGLGTMAGVSVSPGGASIHTGVIEAAVSIAIGHGVREDRIAWVGDVGARDVLTSRANLLVYDPTPTPDSAAAVGPAIWSAGKIAGRPAHASRWAPNSTIFAGDFSTAFIGLHGGIQLVVNPFIDPSGRHRVSVFADVAVIVPNPASFVRITGLT